MKRKYNPTEEELQIIRDHYDGSTLRTCKIMRLLGSKYPRQYVKRKAQALGLARVKEPRWSPKEETYLLDHYPQMGMKKLWGGLKRLGSPRSITAIRLKIRRLGILSTDGDGFNLRGLENFLWGGQENHHIITRWIAKGWLRGKRRGTLRKSSQGGDQWYFSPESVRAFVVAHPEEIDLRLVDAAPFIRLIAGNAEMIVACKCPDCGIEFERQMFNPGVTLCRVYCDPCRQSHNNITYDADCQAAAM